MFEHRLSIIVLRLIGSATVKVEPITVRSVVGLAYEQIRGLIVRGDVSPGGRLGQGELADMLGISRTSVREALRRLTGDGLVEFHTNRGFFVADVGLEAVLRRLEVRLLLEPGIARLAAARRTFDDLEELDATILAEQRAKTAEAAHDASRAFHVALAHATQNDELVRSLESLWIVDVGRRLLAARRAVPSWQETDVAEHGAIVVAVEAKDADRAERLMRRHVQAALQHWSAGRAAESEPAA
jgi:DNA-binding GntR family transcriptional regulator